MTTAGMRDDKPPTRSKTRSTASRKDAKHAAKKTPLKLLDGKAKKLSKETLAELEDDLLDGIEHPDGDDHLHDAQLSHAFHHLKRAGAVISLLEKDSSGDLRDLLEHGIHLYRKASAKKRKKSSVRVAFGLLRAAEHLSMAGLYEARSETRVEVAPPPRSAVAQHLRDLAPRLDKLAAPERANSRRLEAMARDLLTRAESASHDPHLEYELTMAADGICAALEEGL